MRMPAHSILSMYLMLEAPWQHRQRALGEPTSVLCCAADDRQRRRQLPRDLDASRSSPKGNAQLVTDSASGVVWLAPRLH
jgi:hypothetical protein